MANTIEIIIKSKGDSAIKGIGDVNKALSKVGKSLSGVGDTLTRNVTRPIAAVGAALGGLGVLSVATATSFESAFAGVIKTTDGLIDSTGELTAVGAELQKGFRDLAKEIPASVEELLAIGELGGQLGIAKESLLDFTETIAALGETTNLTTEEAAAGFAQLANIMQTPQSQIENMGSAVVELGNNFATTERDILTFATRIAGAGRIARLSESDVFGIAAAFSSVGIEAEAGGTAVQKVLLGINEAVVTSSEQLAVFSTAAGMSADDFAATWKADPSKAFADFVVGLGRAGDDAITILQDLGLEDQRLVRAFLSLANAGELLPKALEMSNQAFIENTALTKEAETRYRTFESRLEKTKNKLRDVGITIGNALVPFVEELLDESEPMIEKLGVTLPEFLSGSLQPAIRNTIEAFRPFGEIIVNLIKGFAGLDPAMQQNIVKIALLAAAAGPAFKIMGAGVSTVGALANVFSKLPILVGGATAALNAWRAGMTLTTALGAAGLAPIAITLGAIGVAAGALVAVWAQWNKQIVQTNREGQKAVGGAWEDFFQKQVESGSSAAQIADEYRKAQDRVRQSLEDANPIVRLFIKDQDELMRNTGAANAALLDASSTFDEYVRAANIAGIGLDKFTEEQFNQIKASMQQESVTGEASAAIEDHGEELLKAMGITEDFTASTEAANQKLLETKDIAGIVKESFGDAGIAGDELDRMMDALGVTLGEVSQEQIDLARDVDTLSDAFAFGVITADEFNTFMLQAASGAIELSQAQLSGIGAAVRHQESLMASAEAARELTLKQLELAQSLKDASQAQIAQTAINELGAAFEDGKLTFEDYTAAVSEVQTTFGLADEQSRTLAEGIGLITGALSEGTLPAENFDEALKFIIEDAATGEINMEGLLEKFGTVPEHMTNAEDSIREAKEEMGLMGEQALTASNDIQTAFEIPDWKRVGTNVSDGIASGITAGIPAIENAARSAANAAYSAAMSELEAKSPSKRFIEVGMNVSAGWAKGIFAGADKIMGAIKRVANNLVNAASPQMAFATASPVGAGASSFFTPTSTSSSTTYGGTTINQHYHSEGAAALGMALVRKQSRDRLNSSMGR